MKKFLLVVIALALLLGAAYFYFFNLRPIKQNNPLSAVPSDAAMIVSLEKPLEQWQTLTNNEIWAYLKTNSFLATFGKSIDSLNAEIKQNETLWDLTAARPMVISLHAGNSNDFDFLYTIDLLKATQFSFLKSYLGNILDDEAKIFTRDYNGIEIIEFSYQGSSTVYYLCVDENLLSMSTIHTLIEKSIDERKKPTLIRDLDFIEVNNNINTDEPAIYFQQQNFKALLDSYLATEPSENSLAFLTYTHFLGLNTAINDEFIAITGFSDLPDTEPNVLQALLASGRGEINLGSLVPENASTFTSLGFADANRFYTNLTTYLSTLEEGELYSENREKIERFLDISVEENIISWIDNEIGVIQLNSNNDKNKVDLAVAIRYKDRDELTENLEYIESKIKRKTPVKFKGIAYKGYDIKFLSIKGFFKLIFGKLFSTIDKPYYVIMEDYIVFSNSPKTLGTIITAKIENKVLNSTKAYADFMDEFDYESNLFIYASAEKTLNDAERLLDNQVWKDLRAHREYIEGFPLLGIQLNPKNDLLSYHLQLKHLNNQEQSDWQDLINQLSVVTISEDSLQDEGEDYIIAVENILPEDLNDKMLEEYYNSGQLKFEVPLKDGLKNGRYSEYDSIGNLIVKGRYKNDVKTGIWKFYDSNGELLRKMKE